MDMGLCGPQSLSGHGGEKKKIPYQESNRDRPSRS
jgi:hypothetical protein